MPRVWSDLIINCNESLAAGWRYSLGWAGPNASISDGYRLHLLQGQAEGTDWVKWRIFNFLDSGWWIQWFIPCCNLAIGNSKKVTRHQTLNIGSANIFHIFASKLCCLSKQEPICERCFPISGFLSSCEPTFGWDKFLELWPAANTDWRRRLQWVFPINLPVKLRNKLGSGTKGQKEEEEKETEESKFWHPKLHKLWYKGFLFNSAKNEECDFQGEAGLSKCL